jgi:hypothetical protein
VALVAFAVAGGLDAAVIVPSLPLHSVTASTAELANAGVRTPWPDPLVLLVVGTALIGLGGLLRRTPSPSGTSELQAAPPVDLRTWTRS